MTSSGLLNKPWTQTGVVPFPPPSAFALFFVAYWTHSTFPLLETIRRYISNSHAFTLSASKEDSEQYSKQNSKDLFDAPLSGGLHVKLQ